MDRFLWEAWQIACTEYDVNLGPTPEVFTLRGSHVRGEAKRNARPLITVHYKFDASEDTAYEEEIATLISQDHEALTGLFKNLCVACIMLQSRSKIENCADKWKDGWCYQVDFTEKLYHKKYECYLDNLQEWGEHTKGRVSNGIPLMSSASVGSKPLHTCLP
ncbi:hypothetical protein JB92DRAFT_2957143 [Gautieria morchelliformis]|nr:hypothetical protein JB92DRAFT_2957143 [Gautieria morchelliformis]